MIYSGLFVAICLVVAVAIVGAAFVWALLETRQASAQRKKYRLSHHLKSRKQSPKAHDR
jgi:ABC-type Mn2+/Zn2+ transport system permease subunit